MGNALKFLISLIPLILLVLSIADYWNKFFLDDVRKESLKQYLIKWKEKISEMGSLDLILHNFILLSKLIDRILGESLFSKKTMSKVMLATGFFLYATLLFKSIPGVSPLSNLAMCPAPSDTIPALAEISGEMCKKIKSEPKTFDLNQKPIQYMYKTLETISHSNTPTIRIGSTLIAFFGTWVLCSVLTIVSLSISKLLLDELQNVRGYFTLVASLVFNFVLTVVLSSLGLFLLLILVVPFIGLPVLGGILISFKYSIYLGLWALQTVLIVLWALSSQWMKAAIILPILPCVLVILSLIFTILTYPFHNYIYNKILACLIKCIDHKLGATSFIISTLIILFIGINFVAHLLRS